MHGAVFTKSNREPLAVRKVNGAGHFQPRRLNVAHRADPGPLMHFHGFLFAPLDNARLHTRVMRVLQESSSHAARAHLWIGFNVKSINGSASFNHSRRVRSFPTADPPSAAETLVLAKFVNVGGTPTHIAP